MKPTITVARAIGAEFIRRKLRPLIIMGAVVAISLLCLGGWLAAHNAWWWLIEAVFICGSLLFAAAVTVMYLILGKVEPLATRTQKQNVRSFVDKLEQLADSLQTPAFFILYYVIRDTIRPRQNGFIETVAHDSKTLAPEFSRLLKDFS
jgi:MFS family permease